MSTLSVTAAGAAREAIDRHVPQLVEDRFASRLFAKDHTLWGADAEDEASKRLGWQLTKFNRKLDNVCDKLDQLGVSGMRGGGGKLASNRRTKLVEYAVSSRIVTREDLPLIDAEAARNAAD